MMLDETDEMELLASVNPEPDVSGNPWDDHMLVLEPATSRRRRWPMWVGAAAASVALVAAGVALRPDDRGDVTTVGSVPTTEPGGPTDVPWNDPIEIRFEAGTKPGDIKPIVVPHPGLWLFELDVPAEMQDRLEVWFCGGFEAPTEDVLQTFEADRETQLRPGMFRCSGDTRAWDPVDQEFVVDVFDEEIRVIVIEENGEGLQFTMIGSLVVGDERELSFEFDGGVRGGWTRNDPVVALTGDGFESGEPLTIVRCTSAEPGYAPVDHRRICDPVATTIADDAGGIEVAVDVPATTLDEVAAGVGLVDLFAFQGDQRSHIVELFRSGPTFVTPSPRDVSGTDMEIPVVGLLPGEVGRLDVCLAQGFECADNPVHSYTILGTGSDDLSVTVPTRGFGWMGLWFSVNDVVLGGTGVPRVPGSAVQLAPGTVDVSPASVPGPGRYTFTVTGSGWIADAPIYVLGCSGEFTDGPISNTDCRGGVRVTPVDGAFTVEVPYDPGGDFVINVADGARTQSGSSSRVTVG